MVLGIFPVKSIYTLIPDVQLLLTQKGWWSDELNEYFRTALDRVRTSFEPHDQKRELRLSRMGDQCHRQLWYSAHHPEYAEVLPASAILKYTYGHIIEALALTLAKAAGHQVEHEQHEITLDGISGHCDAVIDGNIVDVKSSSTRGMAKFKDRSTFEKNDDFGYLDQIDGYVVGSNADVVVLNKKSGFIWAIDKTLGNMTLYEHMVREGDIRSRIQDYKIIVGRSTPPPCTCRTITQGQGSYTKLDVKASYSSYKRVCFPNFRTIIEKDKPIYLV